MLKKLSTLNWMKTLKAIWLSILVVIVVACNSMRTADLEGLYMCPHDARAVWAARGFAGKVYMTDGYYLSILCSGTIGYTLLGCTIPSTYDIYILNSLSRQAQTDTLFHELCHVYEYVVLDKTDTGSHIGWAINPIHKDYYEAAQARGNAEEGAE